MNRGRIFRRRFATRADRFQEAAADSIDKMRDQAAQFAGQARESLARGGEALRTLRQSAIANVRENPSFYLAALLALVGLFIAKQVIDRRREEER